jgi:MoaA/NifB/PqqE/SkfB family radical SAM enzyme
MLPVYLILYVTSKCNLACKHCFFHTSLNKPNELSLKEIERISKSVKLLNVSLTGGEPFLREDLDKIAGFFIKNSKASIISIPTNGMLTEKIVKKVSAMLAEYPETTFNVFVSIDGKKSTHNKIRGSKFAFDNANKTLRELSKLVPENPNFRLGVIFTINEFNSHELYSLYKEISSKYKLNTFNVNFLRGKPKSAKYSSKEIKVYEEINKLIDKDNLAGKREGYRILGDFYTCINKRYRQVNVDTIKQGKFQTPCYAGTTNCVIYPNADVYACEIRNDLFFGNLKDYGFDLKKMLSAPKNSALIKSIRESKCFCTFECQQSSNIAFNISQLTRVIPIWIKFKLGINE